MFLRMFCFCFVVLLCFWRGVFLLGAGRLCYVFRARQRLAIPGLFACLFASLLLCLIFTPQWRILDIVIIDGWLHGAFFLMLRCWKDHPFPGQRNMTTLCNSWRLSRIYPSTSSHIDISVAMTVLLANYKNPEALKMNAWIFSRNICCKDPVNGSRLPEIRDIFMEIHGRWGICMNWVEKFCSSSLIGCIKPVIKGWMTILKFCHWICRLEPFKRMNLSRSVCIICESDSYANFLVDHQGSHYPVSSYLLTKNASHNSTLWSR